MVLVLIVVLCWPGCSGGGPGGPGQARGLFGRGRQCVTQGRYQQAVPLLTAYLAKHPQGRHASRARFFLGKAHLGLGDLVRARAEFQATRRDYPGSLEAHKAQYKLAMVDLWEGHRDAAVGRLGALADRPDGPLAPEAHAMRRFLTRTATQPAVPTPAQAH